MTFIAENIGALKQEYGSALDLGYLEHGELNPVTGKQLSIPHQITIPLAIRLPNQMTFEFLQSIGAGIKALDILVGTIQILVDLADVPAGFNIRAANTYAVYNGRKYNVLKADVYDEAAILWAKDVGVVEPRNTVTPSSLTFSHSIDVSVI